VYLLSSRKLVCRQHLRFLERKHKYRKKKRYFDNTVEKDSDMKWYNGKLLFEMVKNIQVVFRKGTVKG
jgi:sulfate adenylyltransferase subunit 1 (EFTu-like GTPase family)